MYYKDYKKIVEEIITIIREEEFPEYVEDAIIQLLCGYGLMDKEHVKNV